MIHLLSRMVTSRSDLDPSGKLPMGFSFILEKDGYKLPVNIYQCDLATLSEADAVAHIVKVTLDAVYELEKRTKDLTI